MSTVGAALRKLSLNTLWGALLVLAPLLAVGQPTLYSYTDLVAA